MASESDREVRLNFLDEVDEYLNTTELALLSLAKAGVDPQQMDAALRAAHTIKGIGSMIDCPSLSHLAHRFEDSLKIIKARRDQIQIDPALETLLLQAIDSMRQISDRHRDDLAIADPWLDVNAHPIFDQLRNRLGDVQPSDELALLAEEADTDTAVVMFETEVSDLLKRLDTVLANPELPCLPEELGLMVEELHDLGEMLQLDAFSQLCNGIGQALATAAPDQVEPIARRALQLWQRSHALVLVGKLDKLPTQFDRIAEQHESTDSSGKGIDAVIAVDPAVDLEAADLASEADDLTFSDLASLDLADQDLAAFDFGAADLAELQSAIADFIPDPSVPATTLEAPPEAAISQEAADGAIASEEAPLLEAPLLEAPTPSSQSQTQLQPQPEAESSREMLAEAAAQNTPENMVRVPVKLLTQLNDLFGELIIQRNGLNSRLQHMEESVALFARRMTTLEDTNTQLQTFCHQAAVATSTPALLAGHRDSFMAPQLNQGRSSTLIAAAPSAFDSLELDRYSDLHVLSQEQRETVVKLREVASDVKLDLREIKQASAHLNQTAKMLQNTVTRTRMRPFADVVKRFSRTVRDLSLQYDKSVNLKILGGATLIDRFVAIYLRDPLMHLLRNAFDHGIEPTATRQACGKPAQGTIEIKATHRGSHTLISIRDDGAGINLDKIRNRARQMGLPDDLLHSMSEADLLKMIFEPGFSTADQVTDLSGRGIGMDVVHTNLEQIRSDITVDTQPGVGTTFTINVPFTLSIGRVLVVESGGMRLAFPTDSVGEMIRLKAVRSEKLAGQTVVRWQESTIPLIHLAPRLEFRGPQPSLMITEAPIINEPSVLLINHGNQRHGLYIDRFWGEREVVVRQVEAIIDLPPGFNGCTILEDGRVLPLADPDKLLAWAQAPSTVVEPRRSRPQSNSSDLGLGDRAQPPAPSSQVQPARILVIDDSINMRQLLSRTLKQAGYWVEQSKDGQDAVDQLMSGLAVDAIVCDIEMPRLDGYGVLAEVKADPEYQDLPIVMLTSRSSEKHCQIAINLGAAAYITKPYQEYELLEAIAKALEPKA